MQELPKIDLQAELEKCKTMDDLTGKNGLIQRLVGKMVETLLEKEMEEHLGYEKHSAEGDHSGNSRNGKGKKALKSNYGTIEIEVPRDRNGEFEPIAVKKHERSISAFDDKIISMYARGMSTRDIQAHIEELYGAEISATTISNITEKVVETAEEWQARPLQKVYPVIFFDAIHYKVRENGKILSKASYTCLGIGVDGRKDILGIWVGDNEAATFWLRVCTELKNRGVEDVLITCIDGLKGLPDAIKAVFPETTVQLCIVHMIRNSVKYIPSKHMDEFVVDLKAIYNAPTEDKAVSSLGCLQEKWGKKYSLAVRPWEVHWEHLKAFLSYPQEIRRLIYTTNAVESLHRQFRKVTKSKAVFPSDHALFKMLFLAARDVSKKWTMPVHNWTTVISYLAIAYGDRLKLASD